ncbi:uncharacterized protein LOC106174819 [Lingula anatina]|uniref:Uncharacterized protein LOC106174819 n=1 Tax=Lingula anatina TaxID=7574 RepID=A0A1S3JNL5_LINAN|nr:uncharacterized protein LOC106174819 [Lingula anatina]|eukprot:XP_013411965.1 uncharacterized protein LOC106174819 [Lingula anatina]
MEMDAADTQNTMEERLYLIQPSHRENSRDHEPGDIDMQICCFKVSPRAHNIITTIVSVISTLCLFVSYPMVDQSLTECGGDSYFLVAHTVLWSAVLMVLYVLVAKLYVQHAVSIVPTILSFRRVVLVAFLAATGGLLLMYACEANHLPRTLKGVVALALIPMVWMCGLAAKWTGLKDLQLSHLAVIATGTASLFLSLIPQIFDFDYKETGWSHVRNTATLITWAVVMGLALLELCVAFTFMEKEINRIGVHVKVHFAWMMFFLAIFVVLFFWSNFVPSVGKTSSSSEFYDDMIRSAKCSYSLGHESTLFGTWIVVVTFLLSGYLFSSMMQFGQSGATYGVMVQLVGIPLYGIWWELFKYPPLTWEPEYSWSIIFYALGLLGQLIAMVLYRVYDKVDGPNTAPMRLQ